MFHCVCVCVTPVSARIYLYKYTRSYRRGGRDRQAKARAGREEIGRTRETGGGGEVGGKVGLLAEEAETAAVR